MYVHVLYNKIHLLKNLRMKQPVQVNPGLNCSFSYENCIYIYIYIYILQVDLVGNWLLYSISEEMIYIYIYIYECYTVSKQLSIALRCSGDGP